MAYARRDHFIKLRSQIQESQNRRKSDLLSYLTTIL